MKYDIQPYETDKKCKGFYVWNKPTFFVNKKDNRYSSMVAEKKETGMSHDETWDLKTNIAVFLVPRLKLFKEQQMSIGGHPGCFENKEEWYVVLDKMIFAFESEFKDIFYIPDEYIENSSQKIEIYQNIALCKNEEELQNDVNDKGNDDEQEYTVDNAVQVVTDFTCPSCRRKPCPTTTVRIANNTSTSNYKLY